MQTLLELGWPTKGHHGRRADDDEGLAEGDGSGKSNPSFIPNRRQKRSPLTVSPPLRVKLGKGPMSRVIRYTDTYWFREEETLVSRPVLDRLRGL